jgi:rhodanese-related sulfurtransferase
MNINIEQFQEMMRSEKENLEIIDVRERDEFDQIRILDSKLIPLGEIEKKESEIDWSKKVILVCRSGARSGYAQQLLEVKGRNPLSLEGGIMTLEMINCKYLEH